MPPLTWLEARALVIRELHSGRVTPATERVPLNAALNRVLAAAAPADRDYPPFNRATRDGFALHSSEIPARLRIVGQAAAGHPFAGEIHSGEAIEIMTGAPVPGSADAVIMVEHTATHPDGTVETARTAMPNFNISLQGSEMHAGDSPLHPGDRLDYPAIAWLATIGDTEVEVFRKPRVAILSTGDEVVPIDATPAPHQIRNSNAWALAAQIRRAGADPVMLPIAPDDKTETIRLIREGLAADLVLLSGGVSAGKFDFVEPALADLGAAFYFDRVLIQPGQPVVFGRIPSKPQSKFFFGLPGNPGSTMVTFELFARAAIDLLSGTNDTALPITFAKLREPFRHKAGITRFLPARIACGEVTPVKWEGSGDIPAYCRANAFLVADAATPEYAAGEMISVLPR